MTDDFNQAARTQAEWLYEADSLVSVRGAARQRAAFRLGAEWGRNHPPAQEPSDAEVEAVAKFLAEWIGVEWDSASSDWRRGIMVDARVALVSARKVQA